MDSKTLKAPRPVKANPFIIRKTSGQSIKYKRLLYRDSERVKSENFLHNHNPFDAVLNDLDNLEKDFIEIDAKSEILSILNNLFPYLYKFILFFYVIFNIFLIILI